MLRAAMRHAGGVRIDHAMGLARLWVLPDGASAADGVYLHFPVDDMLRLIRLESHRHRAIVLGEDLGTLPDGFQGRISAAGMLGMRVLWFERAQDQGFTAPSHWDYGAVSMTSTHDLATVAGWWSGRDTAWRHELGQIDEAALSREQHERHRDRTMLWSAMQASGAAHGEPPPRRSTQRRRLTRRSAMSARRPVRCRSSRWRTRSGCRSSQTYRARSTNIRTGAVACPAQPPPCSTTPPLPPACDDLDALRNPR